MSEHPEDGFPSFVRNLPRADYAAEEVADIVGYVVQGERCQVVFNENARPMRFQRHVHAESFGVVLQGECELVFFHRQDDGGERQERRRFRAGETYRVPAGVEHYAVQSADYRDIVIFDEPGRVPVTPD